MRTKLALAAALLVGGCQTIVAPDGSRVIERGSGLVEVLPRVVEEKPAPVCLVRARFFRGMIGVPCDQIAQTISP